MAQNAWVTLLACVAAPLFFFGCDTSTEDQASATREVARPIPYAIEPTTRLDESAEVVARGGEIFARQCAACHGASGSGDGEAAYLLYPKPRDFTAGLFRYTSTWEAIPTDDDLFRTISRGMPGSAMPSWAHLPERDRWALVYFVKSLSKEPLVVPEAKPADPEFTEAGEGVIEVPAEPPDGDASRARGATLFVANCGSCHGPSGQGDGIQVASLRDGSDYPIRPRDLTTGVFKGPHRPQDLYRRILGGIADTPMPANPHLDSQSVWDLVHFVRSLSSDLLRARAEMRRMRIVAPRVEVLPDHPDSGAWKGVPSVELHMMPLWWRYNRPEYVTVQAAHDDESIALLLVWSDDTNDTMVVRPQDFRDAVAVEIFAGQDPPFFAMGEKGRFVNIWMWKSERQADIAGFGDIDAQYPNIGIDSYPNLEKSPYEQPTRDAMTLDSNPTFVTGWGAGNIVSNPLRRSAAEDLVAQGFGTLKARPLPDQAVEAHGVYSTGSYRVMLRRTLEGVDGRTVDLEPGKVASIAFAVWNGAAGDRNGKKSVTIWQELALDE